MSVFSKIIGILTEQGCRASASVSSETMPAPKARISFQPGDTRDGLTNQQLRAFAANLFSQQIWCWGRDIMGPQGNLLLRFGFTRTPPPQNNGGTSIYHQSVSPGARIILRGFGVFYGDDRHGGLFVRRDGFSPRMTPGPDLSFLPWRIDQLPPLAIPVEDDLPRCRRLLLDLIDWIGAYELRVSQELDSGYRHRTLVPWQQGKALVVAAEEMGLAWQHLGRVVASNCELLVDAKEDVRSTITDVGEHLRYAG